ncbi:IS110 family transposase [Aquamicrobium terrae]
MTFLHHAPVRCLGVDVARDRLAVDDGITAATVANSRAAIRSLLRTSRPDLVVCEPTGGYELLLLEECLRAGIAGHRADTLRLKAFIRSFGTLGKSDAIDAAQMAAYGRERWTKLPLWQAPDADEKQMQALVRRRADLVAFKVAEQNRSRAPGARAMAASFRAMLATITRQIAALERAIAALVAQNAGLRHRVAICTGMNGIGTVSAVTILALMPELGHLQRRQAAALAGTAPHPNESGTARGRRRQRGGRPQVRTALFMPALRAAAGQGEFAAFYARLIANGKPPILAIAATMRKIIITLNARLRDNQNHQS